MNLKQQLQNAFVEHTREPFQIGEHTVYIRELPYQELQELSKRSTDESGESDDGFALLVVARAMVDEEGNRVFEDDEIEAMSAVPKRRLMEAMNLAIEVNGLTRTDEEADEEGN